MKILVATGRCAENTVRESVGSNADVLVLDTDIAAFITPYKLIKALKSYHTQKYDIVFIPGFCLGDFSVVEDKFDTEVYLGPKHAYDLGYILNYTNDFNFSKTVPACDLLSGIRKGLALDEVAEIEYNSTPLFTLEHLKIGGNSRIKVMAEIVNATSMDEEDLYYKIKEFIDKGADLIDLGASLTASPEEVERTVNVAKKYSSVPLSFDSLDPELIQAAIKNGINLILSLNSSNMNSLLDLIIDNNVSVVIIPDLGKGLQSLISNVEMAKQHGIKNIIADPVLDSLGYGLVDSIGRYKEFRLRYPNIPMFFGVGNVTELIDVDSVGVNGILCGIAYETGCSIVFTPEFSDKNHGSIGELKIASMMMLLSQKRNTSPKDLGIDLLQLKEKRKRSVIELCENPLYVSDSVTWLLDPKGPIKIGIIPKYSSIGSNFDKGLIVAKHEECCLVGTNSSAILNKLIENNLVSRLDHAGYLGRELQKAEIALKFGRSYSQDDEF